MSDYTRWFAVGERTTDIAARTADTQSTRWTVWSVQSKAVRRQFIYNARGTRASPSSTSAFSRAGTARDTAAEGRMAGSDGNATSPAVSDMSSTVM